MCKFTPEYRAKLLRPVANWRLSPQERADRIELSQIIRAERQSHIDAQPTTEYAAADPYLNDNRQRFGSGRND